MPRAHHPHAVPARAVPSRAVSPRAVPPRAVPSRAVPCRPARARRRRAHEREGAAMLMVLMVLLMTTATATFAIHSTSMELRAAGHARTAMQTAYVAEGGAYATLAYMDATGAQGVFVQYIRTRVNANQQISPNEATINQDMNLLRVEMDDFASAPGVIAPPIETDYTRTPSYGPRNANVANFTADVVDVHDAGAAARPGTVGSAEGQFRFVRINLTSRGRMAPPGDITVGTDPRTYHQSSANARAVGLVGPFAGGG